MSSDITKDLRPISLTATLSKTCERFVADWLMELIDEKIDKRQFGSLKNSSTTHALLSLLHHLLNETDVSKNAVRIFLLDFSKAFDHIDHNILLSILSDMDVPSLITNWIRIFLLDEANGSECPIVCQNGKSSTVEYPNHDKLSPRRLERPMEIH